MGQASAKNAGLFCFFGLETNPAGGIYLFVFRFVLFGTLLGLFVPNFLLNH